MTPNLSAFCLGTVATGDRVATVPCILVTAAHSSQLCKPLPPVRPFETHVISVALLLLLCRSSSLHRTSLTGLNPSTTPTTTKDIENEAMRELIHHSDANRDGKIFAFELMSYFGSIGDYLSPDEAQGLIQDLDSDGDHLLDFQDFMKLVTINNDDDLKKAFEMFVWEKENTEASSSSSGEAGKKNRIPKMKFHSLSIVCFMI
ncbi:hypothetical protein S83_039347 [Arachis hypogaea]